ncbi:hypothetical protein LAZ67_5003819 [Cordylochernes scorpioides]|uniref:MaoC-like domain-containing protein n=1 Tax=Cordylochernes scorpioides TaxID=51811 RepID=A0ABY6KMC6_9ARAC|nr:hypothetical protein LAZ67_5003817 [Cordylochernes scorpioides]UYV68310.1 hypothetical protein LAZ67_5003819 [Cordylochernes scorpioides]
MVETRSGKMQEAFEERIKTEESAKPQPGATIKPQPVIKVSRFKQNIRQEISNVVFSRFHVSLLQRKNRKGVLHRIVTGDENWIHYDYPKRRATYGYPGRAILSTAKPNIHVEKIMLCMLIMQGVVYYELLQPNERITGEV